jgi:glycosyltransferase involved in cell wall biosynthesis
MQLFFWENMVAFHQSAHVRALTEMGHEVTFIAEEVIYPQMQAMGWLVPDMGKARVVVTNDRREVQQMVLDSSPEAVHIVGGVRGHQIGRWAARTCLDTSRRVGFTLESLDHRGFQAIMRHLLYAGERLALWRKIDFVLARGQTGVDCYRRLGYPAERIFPYGYWTEIPSHTTTLPTGTDSNRVELFFLGQYIDRKGIDLALKALSQLPHLAWHFTIVGSGPAYSALTTLCQQAGLQERVRFLPALPNNEAQQLLKSADVLLLPSRFDGWGAVVNEALMQGIPVVCSDRCGAGDLLRESWRGELFRSESLPDLARVLEKWIARGKRTPTVTERISNWSHCITGDSAAGYLLAVLSHLYTGTSRPVPPWYPAEK